MNNDFTELLKCSDHLDQEWSLSLSPLMIQGTPYYHIFIHADSCHFSLVGRHLLFRNTEVTSPASRTVTFRAAPFYKAGMEDDEMTKIEIREIYSPDLGRIIYSLEIDSHGVNIELSPPDPICEAFLATLEQLCGELPSLVVN